MKSDRKRGECSFEEARRFFGKIHLAGTSIGAPAMEPGGGGGGQDFRLTWVNYSQKLTEAFNKFLSRETLCNVTLSVNRRSIKAHQVGSSSGFCHQQS